MMEVTGKKHRNLCKPCEKRKSFTYTDRSCLHCEEEMCQSCFDTHVQFKVSREHRLVKSFEVPLREETPTLDNCTKHLNEAIKFFCPEHNQVGCADCIIISHKNCKVEYILEHINEYKDSEESKIFKGNIDRYNIEAKQMLESIKRKKCHVTDVNNKFACAVRLFRDEMISHITHLADRMLKLGDDAMTVDMTTIENLEKESKSLVDETTKMRETLQSEADQPYRLFITAVSYKHNLHLVEEQLQRIEQTSRVTTYWFERDCHLEELVKSYKQLGSFQVVQKHHREAAMKVREVYYDQWTDAFEILVEQMEEKQVIHTLLNTLMTAYDTCQELLSRNDFERDQKAIKLPEEAVRARLPLAKHQSIEVQEYVSACVEITWLCAVQDPPLELDAKFTDRFDTNLFEYYTRKGDFLEFVVWPALLFNKGGPLLSKGVAQGKK